MKVTKVGMLLLAGAWFAPASQSQVIKAPRYQSPVDAPQQVLNMPPLPPAITPGGTVVEDIVVRINDQIISRSEVARQQHELDQAAAQGNVPRDQLADTQKNMLRDMIDQQLLLSRAKELGLNADAELVRRLDEIRKQNNMDSMDALQKAAQSQGINFEDFKAAQKSQILTQMVVRDEVGRRLQMTQTDEKKYYDEHIQDFQQPEQVKLSEIIIPVPETATPEQVTQAEAKANDVRAMAAGGQDFGELAKKYSSGTSAAQGGDLGTFKPGALPKVFEDASFKLKPGELTQPIRSRQGFVLLEVIDHQQAGAAPMKEVEQKIEEGMYMQQMQPALRAYLTKLRNDAYVDIQPGFVDSGATPNETKQFLNTAYAAPVPKKKTVKQKGRYDRNGAAPVTTAAASKGPLVASPDTTGTRTLTGADAQPEVVATPAANIDAATGMAKMTAPPANSKGKPKVAKREKIRYGQAPRNSLGGNGDETTTTASARVPLPAAGGTVSAPGAAIASNGTSESANLNDNPLTPVAPVRAKTRLSDKQAEVKEKKVKTVTAKQVEKAKAIPDAMTADEKAAAKIQGAPLGLAGDTTKKQKKPKKQKGTAKERLAEKAPGTDKPAAPAIEQTANPALAPTAVSPGPATPPVAPTTPPKL